MESIASVPLRTIFVFSYVGYTTQEIEVGGNISINVVLVPEIGTLEEVLVIGYGTVKKKDVTGSIVNVSTEEMADRPVANIGDALQGMVAGVTVTNNGGSPAEPPTIRIRGNSTLNAEGPLWIVDGVINQNGVDPNEIESITVLKDASAAIYGTRASGGVILVETKKGSKGLKVDLNVKYGWKTPWKKLDVMNAAEYCDYYTQLYTDAGQPIPTIYSDPYFRTTRTEWLDEVFQTGVTQDYSFSISGGSDKSTFALFANWKDIEGTLHNTWSKSGRIRLTSDHKISKFLTIGENISIASSRTNGADTQSGYSGVVLGSVYYPPSAKVWTTNPETGKQEYSGVIDQYDPNIDLSLAGQFGDLYNPYALLDRTNPHNPNLNALMNVYGIVNIIDGLKFKSNFSYNYSQSYFKNFRERILEPGKVYDYNQLSTSASQSYSMVWEQLLTYDKTFGAHSISALAGYTAESYESEGFNISAREFASEEEWAQEYVNASLFNAYPSSSYGKNTMVSMLGRVAYSYASKYYLTGVIRRDGTSKVTKDNRWGTFPSVSAAWRISQESFLRDVEFLSDLKIRASWGQMGNINPLGNYETAVPLSLSTRTMIGDPPARLSSYYMNGISNDQLKWETTTSTDVGFDALFLNNRLSASFRLLQ